MSLTLSVLALKLCLKLGNSRTQPHAIVKMNHPLETGTTLPLYGISYDSVSVRDIENLLFLKEEVHNFAGGLLIYTGSEIKQLASNIYAVPYTTFCQ